MKKIFVPLLIASMSISGAANAVDTPILQTPNESSSTTPEATTEPDQIASENPALNDIDPTATVNSEKTSPSEIEIVQSAPASAPEPSASDGNETISAKEANQPDQTVAAEAPPAQEAPQSQQVPSMVGKASSQSANAARNRAWQNVAIAAGAVAIAVTALILVHNNKGHHSHKH